MSARVKNGLKFLGWVSVVAFAYGSWLVVTNISGLPENLDHLVLEVVLVVLGWPVVFGVPAFILGWLLGGGSKDKVSQKVKDNDSSATSPVEVDTPKQSFSDEYYYSVIAKEMELNRRVPALWIQALELAEGNPQKQVSEYIKLRFRSLKSEKEKRQADSETVSLVRDKPNVDRDQPTLNDGKPARRIDRPTLDINRSNPDRDRAEQLRDKAIKKLNIDSFIELIKTNPPLEVLESYFEGLYAKDITKFVNTSNACEQYPLHESIKNGYEDIAQWLLDKCANPIAKNYWGKTAVDIASDYQNRNMKALIEKYL